MNNGLEDRFKNKITTPETNTDETEVTSNPLETNYKRNF
jgi:hypothetical protein